MSSRDKNLDAELLEALTGLESSIPDGYFDQFPRNIGARLEVEVMDAHTHTHTDADTTEPFELAARTSALKTESSKSDSDREENSGLHEIKALANTAKSRISRRVSTQSDAEESLLVSASSSALSAVLLPEPGKELKGVVAPQAAVLGATPATAAVAEAAVASYGGPKKPTPIWAFAAVGVVAAAAIVVAVVFMKQGGGDEVAVATPSEIATPGAAATATADEAPPPPAADPAPETGAMIADTEEDSDGVEGEAPATEAATDDAPADSAEPMVAALPAKAAKDRDQSKRERRAKDKSPDKADNKKATKTRAPSLGKEEDKSQPDPNYKAAPKGSSLDDVLDSVTGGVDEQKEAKKVAGPTKTTITGSDVSKAMGKVRGRAAACYSAEEFTGSVQVKFTVKPDGSLSNVKAVGKHKSSKTGKCVVKAVKRAKFPAFSGAPMSFTFPFLLSQP
jgi:hypothetical protein